MELSGLEIYNETIRDLLASSDEHVKHEIKLVETNTGRRANEVYVSNLAAVPVENSNQVGREHVV